MKKTETKRGQHGKIPENSPQSIMPFWRFKSIKRYWKIILSIKK